MEKKINAERAIEKALEVAKKANLPLLLVSVINATEKNGIWEVVLEVVGTDMQFLAKIDSKTGECLAWNLLKK